MERKVQACLRFETLFLIPPECYRPVVVSWLPLLVWHFGSFTESNENVEFSRTVTDFSINWTILGGVPEIVPGQFRFTDVLATNSPTRFYRVRSP